MDNFDFKSLPHTKKSLLNPDFRRATAGFPLFCLEILAGWPAISCLVQNTFWGWQKVTLHGNVQTASAAALEIKSHLLIFKCQPLESAV